MDAPGPDCYSISPPTVKIAQQMAEQMLKKQKSN
jgi:hypothetical protein